MTKIEDKQKELDKIKQQILDDKITPQLAAGATQLVFGDGRADADIVFVGEAPGKSEDEQGLPFVGAAGKFLNEMLEMIGLKRADVYITNIVKYRPPGNRDPLPDEKAAFLPFLKKQLHVIQPKLIVTLGRHSLETLLPGFRISQIHGQPKRVKIAAGGPGVDAMQDDKGVTFGQPGKARLSKSQLTTSGEQRTELYKDGTAKEQSQPATQQSAAKGGGVSGSAGKQASLSWVILPLFHPAAALYNNSMRQTLIDDFMRIPAVLKKIDSYA